MASQAMTQRVLAQRLGVTQSAISAWKSGAAEPNPRTVFAIERALRLVPGQLSRHLGYLPLGAATADGADRVEAAIAADAGLSRSVKQAFVRLYRELTQNGRQP